MNKLWLMHVLSIPLIQFKVVVKQREKVEHECKTLAGSGD